MIIWPLYAGSDVNMDQISVSTKSRLPNILIKFPGKPYEIKEILVHMGGGRKRPTLDPPLP